MQCEWKNNNKNMQFIQVIRLFYRLLNALGFTAASSSGCAKLGFQWYLFLSIFLSVFFSIFAIDESVSRLFSFSATKHSYFNLPIYFHFFAPRKRRSILFDGTINIVYMIENDTEEKKKIIWTFQFGEWHFQPQRRHFQKTRKNC